MAVLQRIVSAPQSFKQSIVKNGATLPLTLLLISAIAAAASVESQHRLREQSAARIHTFVNRTYGFKVSYDGTLVNDYRNDNGFVLQDPQNQSIAIGVYDYPGDMTNFINTRSANLGPNVTKEQRTFAHINGTMLSSEKGDMSENAFYFHQEWA